MNKSSLVRKYWMAITGLFLCLFLIGHLLGNLQLLISGFEGKLRFNSYAVFMTTNPFVKILSYVTYLGLIFHAVEALILTILNKKAKPIKYKYNKPEKNSNWNSRNMGLLGTIILAFIIIHMSDFWYEYKFCNIPYMETQTQNGYISIDGTSFPETTVNTEGFIINSNGEQVAKAMKDLHEEVIEEFKVLGIVILYIISMIAISFHLWHGFSSAFQSFGLVNRGYFKKIETIGYVFAIIVPLLFAIIPIYIYLTH